MGMTCLRASYHLNPGRAVLDSFFSLGQPKFQPDVKPIEAFSS